MSAGEWLGELDRVAALTGFGLTSEQAWLWGLVLAAAVSVGITTMSAYRLLRDGGARWIALSLVAAGPLLTVFNVLIHQH